MCDRWLEVLRRALEETTGLGDVFSEILDRRERTGRLPSRATLRVADECVPVLREILSTRAVAPRVDGRVRLDLALAERTLRAQGGPGLEELLYAVLGRTPRDPLAEEADLRAGLAHALGRLARERHTSAAWAFVDAERQLVCGGGGEFLAMARAEGLAAAVEEIERLVELVDAVLANEGPIRLANFAARSVGSSKALAPGSDRHRRVATILLRHDPGTKSEVWFGGEPRSDREAQRLAIEVHGIYRDEAALSVLCFGPFVYAKDGERFDHVLRHAARGECVRLTMQQLRGSSVLDLPVEWVTIVENQTPFLDYVERLSGRPAACSELVVASEGQASWATVTLLKLLARRGVRFRHAGDLDRSGVLILRSLAHRARIALEPLFMDVTTHQRFRDRGTPVLGEELERLRLLVADDDPSALGHDLLREILRTGLWLEQEAFSAETLLAITGHHDKAR